MTAPTRGFVLVVDDEISNRYAIARVLVQAGYRVVEAGTGEGNQNDLTLHFGLGDHEMPVEVEIAWPGGQKQLVPAVETNRVWTVPYAPAP